MLTKRFFIRMILLVIAIGAGGILMRQGQQGYEAYQERMKLEKQKTELEAANVALHTDIDAFHRPEAIDQEARTRLNLQKEGEHVVVILPPKTNEEKSTDVSTEAAEKHKFDLWEKLKAWIFNK